VLLLSRLARSDERHSELGQGMNGAVHPGELKGVQLAS
jgi:hypothetical protein